MTFKLNFVHETEAARLYRTAAGVEHWVPRSVTERTLKWPAKNGQPAVHEVTIEDWWLRQNPIEV